MTAQQVTSGIITAVSDKGNIKIGQDWYNFPRNWEGMRPIDGDHVRVTYHDWQPNPGKSPFHMIDDYTIDVSAPAPSSNLDASSDWLPDSKPIVTRLACQRDAISLVAAWLSQHRVILAPDGEIDKRPFPEPFTLQELEEQVLGLAIRLEAAATWGRHGTTSDLDG